MQSQGDFEVTNSHLLANQLASSRPRFHVTNGLWRDCTQGTTLDFAFHLIARASASLPRGEGVLSTPVPSLSTEGFVRVQLTMEEAFAAEVNATTPEEIEAAQAAQAEIEARSELLRNAPPAAGSPYRVTTPRSVATKRRVPWVSTIILLAFGSWAANEAYLRNGHDLLLSFGIGVLAAFALWIPARVYAAERRAKADLYAAPGHLQTSPAETAARNGLGPAIHGPAQVVDDTMPCPRCAETIKRAAKMCRFCLLEMSD